MSDGLDGKVAFITGAGQGIGQGIAFSLAKRGVSVVVVGRTLSKCENTVRLIQERFGQEALAIGADITDLDQLPSLIEQTIARFGRLDILVNNAVSATIKPLLKLTQDDIHRAMMSGPTATLLLMQAAYPHLSKQGGSIVNMASSAAKRWDMTNYGLYAAEKEAIRALTRTAASEWGGDNIRSNCILPHAKSPALEWWTQNRPEEAAAFVKTIPMQRIGECEEDIGEFVALLCSDQSRYINGQSIAVDGGQAYMG